MHGFTSSNIVDSIRARFEIPPVRPSPAHLQRDTSDSNPRASTRLQRIFRAAGWIAGTLTFICLLIPVTRTSFPPLPPRIMLEVTFPRGLPNRAEPLIVTGSRDNADTLAVRYLDEENAVL